MRHTLRAQCPPAWREVAMMSSTPIVVAVLHGGPSSEHEVSIQSASGVIAALRQGGHTVHPVFVDRAGQWHFSPVDSPAATAMPNPLPLWAAIEQLRALRVEVSFLAFHGTYGEDGKIQAALELAGLRYTGSGVTATAVAMDKPLARRVFQGVGVPVAQAVELSTAGLSDLVVAQAAAARVVAALGCPTVVKVPAGGSSVGVEIPQTQAELTQALLRLCPGVDHLLCEQFIGGVELTSGVIEGASGQLISLPIVEIVPKGAAFFDYNAKYGNQTDEIVPARISPAHAQLVADLGVRAHLALGCRGVSRTDIILRHDGQPFVLETNTLPGLTAMSLLPKAAEAAGYSYLDLVQAIIAAALRHQS